MRPFYKHNVVILPLEGSLFTTVHMALSQGSYPLWLVYDVIRIPTPAPRVNPTEGDILAPARVAPQAAIDKRRADHDQIVKGLKFGKRGETMADGTGSEGPWETGG